jgi:hypothetical protein
LDQPSGPGIQNGRFAALGVGEAIAAGGNPGSTLVKIHGPNLAAVVQAQESFVVRRRARRGVPQLNRAIDAAGCEPLTVVTECGALHFPSEIPKCQHFVISSSDPVHGPQLDGPIGPACDEALIVRTERQRIGLPVVRSPPPQHFTGAHVPNPDGRVEAGGGKALAIFAENKAGDRVRRTPEDRGVFA